MDEKMPESASSLDIPQFSNLYFFSSTYFIFIPIKVSIDSFSPEADCRFPNNIKVDLYIGIGMLIGQNWQKWF